MRETRAREIAACIYDFENFIAAVKRCVSLAQAQDLGQNFAVLGTSHLSYLIELEKNVVLGGNAYALRVERRDVFKFGGFAASNISVDASINSIYVTKNLLEKLRSGSG